MKRLLILIGCIGAAFLITGCNYTNSKEYMSPIDSWYKAPPFSLIEKIINDKSKGKVKYCAVLPSMRKKAISSLEKEPLVPIAKDDVDIYCGSIDIVIRKRKLSPFLVRALTVVEEATNDYSVIKYTDSLWVDNPVLPTSGNKSFKMYKDALIVFLPQQPANIYVTTAMMAE